MSKPLKPPRASARQLRKRLTDLSKTVAWSLSELDAVMKEPESYTRGQKIAQILNSLEYQNDAARYFGLGIDYRKDKKRIARPEPPR